MPRLRQVPREEVRSASVLAQYERLFPGRDPVKEPGTKTGSPGNWWTVFAQVPEIIDQVVENVKFYTSPDRKLSPALRQIAQVRAGWLSASKFVYSQHCKGARAAGVSDEKIAAIHAWQAAKCFDERERTLLTYVDYLVGQRGRVPDPIFAALKEKFSEVEILELTYVTCVYDMHSVMNKALRLEYDDFDDPVVEVPAPPAL
jgi:alkylhydroperoxidase family enzyme